MENKINIINAAFEKFKHVQNEICYPLFDMLRKINILEKDIFEKNEMLDNKYLSNAEPKPELNSKDKLWSEFRQGYSKIVDNKCTDKLLKKGYGICFSSTPKYAYIDEKCDVIFTMEVPKKAVVEIHYSMGTIKVAHRFKFIMDKEKWLINSFEYRTQKEGVWHRGSI